MAPHDSVVENLDFQDTARSTSIILHTGDMPVLESERESFLHRRLTARKYWVMAATALLIMGAAVAMVAVTVAPGDSANTSSGVIKQDGPQTPSPPWSTGTPNSVAADPAALKQDTGPPMNSSIGSMVFLPHVNATTNASSYIIMGDNKTLVDVITTPDPIVLTPNKTTSTVSPTTVSIATTMIAAQTTTTGAPTTTQPDLPSTLRPIATTSTPNTTTTTPTPTKDQTTSAPSTTPATQYSQRIHPPSTRT
ncbi:Aste57867_13262 [Aphanomyces stellatus]|uniref:Aste57867_13262 protein n=1 Tax=Aphanomyces stellatus TaxID=120398 RepID=A0A485KY01_9STRA|nr:hypothetical protein As57867_013213 [Aphanomyces stellatus]VFT90102.1 Aste57867_13262 [Aphanomyces stellatus]